ncbi:MAG: hypothetical protein LBG61_04015 [Burkholderiales bacterium]|nr:hypothetical protein [Burkholderiales bacterium]
MIAAAYAHNNNKVFIPDPRGLSPEGFYRRLETMISSALKYGTTKHLGVGEVFRDPFEYYYGDDYEKEAQQFLGLGLDWREGDDVHNLESMLELAYNIALRDFPFIKDYGYNFTEQQYVDLRTNATVDREVYSRGIQKSPQDGATANRGGSTTAARAVLYISLRQAVETKSSSVVYDFSSGMSLWSRSDTTSGTPAGKRKAPESLKGLFYEADTPRQPRGYFNPEQFAIVLTKSQNASTFLHESGHFFLEMNLQAATQLQRDAQTRTLTDKEQALLKDVQTLLDWFGVPDAATWETLDIEQRRPHHEKFAQGFEKYLMEGKAPSVGLKKAFARFAAWLKSVYGALATPLRRVKLTKDVRQVMDRMLAVEAEIEFAQHLESAQPLFTDATKAGMTAEEYDAYQAAQFHLMSARDRRMTFSVLSLSLSGRVARHPINYKKCLLTSCHHLVYFDVLCGWVGQKERAVT